MTAIVGKCPNCGAPVAFQWAGAVQTTCAHCHSVVVRHDVDLKTVGEVSDLPADSSPIQIGTEGRVDDKAFTVIGRIVYEHEDGGWNEWHLIFGDGTSGWLSDALAEYAVSRQMRTGQALPAEDKIKVGRTVSVDGTQLEVTTLTRAHYKGVEGELPFEYWGRDEILFADLRGADAAFATIDYSEKPPLLFAGSYVEYDDLALKNTRAIEDQRSIGAGARGFNCPKCGAAIELRALRHALAVACTSCGAIVDPHDPNLRVLQEADRREAVKPAIPLGTRGTVDGQPFDVVGFQRRSIEVEGVEYFWSEYTLFNPYRGFRYLSEYQGHWNLIRTLHGIPGLGAHDGKDAGAFRGSSYRHFQSARAATRFVMGEFPWRVRVGDKIDVADYVAPPHMMSVERTDDEVTWSLGEYHTGDDIWKMFGLTGEPPATVGVFANQPSPYAGQSRRYWIVFAWLAAALVVALLARTLMAGGAPVFSHGYAFQPGSVTEASFVTETFAIPSAGTVQVEVNTDVRNSWIYFDLALIDNDSGAAMDFGREVSYYSGVDSDGSWSEGSNQARWLLPRVPAGDYYLRVEPEGATVPVNYTVIVRRDVMSWLPYAIAFGLLLVPPAFVSLRAAAFERRRWAESDHAPDTSADDDDDDDE